jgi:adenylate kinase
MARNRLVFMGVPGSGKGTQSKFLADLLKIPTISTGDIIRSHIKRGTKCGETLKYYNNNGLLAPNEIVLGMVSQAICSAKVSSSLSALNPNGGWILDGFPRNEKQVEDLDNLLLGMEEPSYDCVIYLDVPDDVVIERIAARAAIENREDDKTAMQKRLEVYHEETAPLRQLFKGQNKLITINGNRAIGEIVNELKHICQNP